MSSTKLAAPMTLLKAMVVAALMSGVLAGCGSSDDVSTEVGDDAADAPATEYRSPIAEFLGVDFTDADAMQERFTEMEAEAERRTAECMAGLGFEYVPRDTSDMIVSFGGPGELDYGSDEWVATYGFGMSTMRFPQSMVGPDLVGFPDEGMPGPGDEPDDPNEEYLDSLSDGEREAYERALWGEGPDIDPSSMTDEEIELAFRDFEPTGCANTAREAVFNEGPGIQDEFYEAFGDQLQTLYERIEADPRIVEARERVSACVAEQGLDLPIEMDDLYERFESRLSGIGMEMMDPFAGTGLNPEEMSDEELEDFFDQLGPPQLSDEDLAVLAEVQAEEIELALAAHECGGGPGAEQRLFEQVRIEYEQRFLDENADDLEQYRGDG